MLRLNKKASTAAICAAVVFCASSGFYRYIKTPVSRNELKTKIDNSVTIRDRNGRFLSRFYSETGGTFVKVKFENIPIHLIQAAVSVEDKRFFEHRGVDPYAVFRAFKANLVHHRIVSGGSTITQQLVRLNRNITRSYANKIQEMITALKYESTFTKNEIITAYLNRVFLGNNIYGAGAGAEIYFGKRTEDLSVSECAFIAGIIKSGTKFNPLKHKAAAEMRRRYVLSRMKEEGYISRDQYDIAISEGVKLQKINRNRAAPHFCIYARDRGKKISYGSAVDITTTLDYDIQKKAESVLKNNSGKFKGSNVKNAALVVLDASNGDILSMIGSLDYYNSSNQGQINGALCLRQPGSTLKPFLYSYIFSKGNSPASVISDIKTDFPTLSGDYSPHNYDRKYHGPVSVREALSCSYNIPAVKWLSRYSSREFIDVLKRSGISSLKRDSSYYGLGIALGSAEVSLLDLVQAYTVFANKGRKVSVESVKEYTTDRGRRVSVRRPVPGGVIAPEYVYMVNNVLTDRNARLRAFPNLRGIIFPFDIAFKTGTSKNYRDAWVVGYNRKYIIGIWLGNFKGDPMRKVTGGNGAVPILYDLFLELNPELKNFSFVKPANVVKARVCPLSGLRVSENCPGGVEEIFVKGCVPLQKCAVHRLYAKNGEPGYKRVFSVLSSEYSRWCFENNWSLPDQNWGEVSSAGSAGRRNRSKDVSVVFPDDMDIFTIDPVVPVEFQKIELRAVLPEGVVRVEWYLDGGLVSSAVCGTQKCSWGLVRGEHVLFAVAILGDGSKVVSERVRFRVM